MESCPSQRPVRKACVLIPINQDQEIISTGHRIGHSTWRRNQNNHEWQGQYYISKASQCDPLNLKDPSVEAYGCMAPCLSLLLPLDLPLPTVSLSILCLPLSLSVSHSPFSSVSIFSFRSPFSPLSLAPYLSHSPFPSVSPRSPSLPLFPFLSPSSLPPLCPSSQPSIQSSRYTNLSIIPLLILLIIPVSGMIKNPINMPHLNNILGRNPDV